MIKHISLFIIFVFILSLPCLASPAGRTVVLIDGMSVKELTGIQFTLISRQVIKENEGRIKVEGKIISKGASALLDRINDSFSKFEVSVTNSISGKDEDMSRVVMKDCEIKSVSKKPNNWVYHFTAEGSK